MTHLAQTPVRADTTRGNTLSRDRRAATWRRSGSTTRTLEIRGGLSRDHLVTVGGTPLFNQPGGPGVYAALAASLAAGVVESRGQGAVRTQLRAALSDDDADIRALLARAGVDLTHCTEGTIPRLWILNSPEGRRVVATRPPTGTHELDESDASLTGIEFDEPSDADVLLRCSPARGLRARRSGQIVLVDPDQRAIAARGWDHIEELARTTDVFLPSRVQLLQLGPSPWAAALELRRRTSRAVVARLDAEGSLVLPARGEAWLVQGPRLDVVDTTGAGDSHAGALAAALADPRDPRSLVNATVVATAVVGRTLAGPGPAGLAATREISPHEVQAVRVTEKELP